MSDIIEWLKLQSNKKFEDRSLEEIYHEMVDEYMGTCSGMSEEDFKWLDENGQLTNWDSEIFNCNCGWWCEIAEEHDEGYCSDCEPEEEYA